MPAPLRIGLIGDFHPTFEAHQAIPRAVALAAADLPCDAEMTWLPTAQVERSAFRGVVHPLVSAFLLAMSAARGAS